MICGHHSPRDVSGGLVDERRQQRRQQVDLDPLALAGRLPVAQRRRDAERRVQSGDHVDERDPDLGGLARAGSGHRHEPADGLHEQVVPGQPGPLAAAEAGDGGVDDRGVGRPDVGVAEPEALHGARREVLDDDVSACRERLGVGAALVGAQVERRGALVAVDAEEVGGLALARTAAPTRGCRRRLPGRSTLTTSAPRSASSMVAYGPASTRLKSAMRTPSRGPVTRRLYPIFRRQGAGGASASRIRRSCSGSAASVQHERARTRPVTAPTSSSTAKTAASPPMTSAMPGAYGPGPPRARLKPSRPPTGRRPRRSRGRGYRAR